MPALAEPPSPEPRPPDWTKRFRPFDIDRNKVTKVTYSNGRPFYYEYQARSPLIGTGIEVDPRRLVPKPGAMSVGDEEAIEAEEAS